MVVNEVLLALAFSNFIYFQKLTTPRKLLSLSHLNFQISTSISSLARLVDFRTISF